MTVFLQKTTFLTKYCCKSFDGKLIQIFFAQIYIFIIEKEILQRETYPKQRNTL